MNHKVVDHIYGVDHDIFQIIVGNRALDPAHVRKIKKAMLNGATIPEIIVDQTTLGIVDGQHRHAAALLLWKEGIPYVLRYILKDYPDPVQAAKDYNTNSKGWNAKAFVDSFIALGHEDYKLLNDFCESHPLLIGRGQKKYTVAAAFLTKSICKVSSKLPPFRSDAMFEAEKFYDQIEQLSYKLDAIAVFFKAHVVIAWIRFSSAYLENNDKFEEYLGKVSKAYKMPQGSSVEDWKEYFKRMMA